jgi:hypothetical protein
MNFDCCPDRRFVPSVRGLTLLTTGLQGGFVCGDFPEAKTLCFLCYLLFKFFTLLGLQKQSERLRLRGFSGSQNPLFPLLPSVQILYSLRVAEAERETSPAGIFRKRKTLCFLCCLLFKFSTLLGLQKQSGRLRPRRFSGTPKPLCFLCHLLFKFSTLLGLQKQSGRLRLRGFSGSEKPFVSFATFCSNSLLS